MTEGGTGQLPEGWALSEGKLARTWECKGFNGAQQLAGVVAYVANQLGHHPDITMHDYKYVTVTSVSHDAGAVTDRDRDLARRINTALDAAGG
jgi:4a-hydroxytetrahydrobiopterin dehydratase